LVNDLRVVQADDLSLESGRDRGGAVDDQIGCPTFAPIDEAEARLTARNRQHRAQAHSGVA
jgi:hypothetical protein